MEVVFDRSGRSEGVALVHFSKRAAARDFASEYDGVKLDGQRMKVTTFAFALHSQFADPFPGRSRRLVL